MLVNGINFPEIKREYDYYTVTVQNKKIKLIYRVSEYVIVPSLEKVRKLKKHGFKLKKFGHKHEDGKVTTAYYRPYAIKVTSLKQKQRTIQMILNMLVGEEGSGLTLEQHIERVWSKKNAHKTSNDNLMDKEAMILDTLASYYLGGVEGEGILTQDMSRTIKKKEYTNLVSGEMQLDESGKETKDSKDSRVWQIRLMNKKKFNEVNKRTPKKWRKSRTYKLGQIYSYNDHKDEVVWWDWLTQTWKGLDQEYHFKIDRLIDPERPYKAKWCIVDTDNVFQFEDKVLQIDKSVVQYRVGKDNYAEMDRVLVIEQLNDNGEMMRLYYDQNIDPIQSNKIKMLK